MRATNGVGSTGLATLMLLTLGLSGCFGVGAGSFDPVEDYEPTGNTVRLRATVLDLLDTEVYPGLKVNFWAFCFQAQDPADQYSVDAVEYFSNPTQDVADPNWQGKCSVPGPTIRVQQGDMVEVQFENNHAHHHTIHWHGQYVPWEHDGVPGSTQDSVGPGKTFVYEFEAKRAGTLWYHCHVDTQMHVMQGLYGVFIIEPQDKTFEPKDIDREQVLVYSTLRREHMENTPARQANPHIDHQGLGGCGETGQPGCQNPAMDITADTFLLNGVSFPNTLSHNDGLITIEPGERVRLRILNAGTTFETLHPHGHDFEITHTDGNPIPPGARVFKDSVPIGPGERLDVVLEGREGNAGIWVMHTHVVNHVTNDGQYPGGALTKIVYPEYLDDLHPFRSELPGGQDYIEPVKFPSDRVNGTKFGLGTSASVSEQWTFEVPMACATKTMKVIMEVDSPPAVQAGNDITIELWHPNGDKWQTFDIGDKRYMEWTYTYDPAVKMPLQTGTYEIRVLGRAVDAVAALGVVLDHYDDHEEHKAVRSPCGVVKNGPQ